MTFTNMETDSCTINVTPLPVLVIVLFLSGTSAVPTTTEQYISTWITKGDDIAVLLCSPHEPASALPKLFHQKATVWRATTNQLFSLISVVSLIIQNRHFNVKTVVFVSPCLSNLKMILRVMSDPRSRILSHWVLLANEEMFQLIINSALSVPPYHSVCTLGLDKTASPVIVRCLPKPQDELPALRASRNLARHITEVSKIKAFSGEDVVVGCLSHKYQDWCEMSYYKSVRELLLRKNVTLTLLRYRSVNEIFDAFYEAKIDIILVRVGFDDTTLEWFSFADMFFEYRTFYSLANSSRVLSMAEAIGSSSCMVLTAFCLILCALTVAATRVPQISRNYIFIAAEEAFFLLASFLNTSSLEHQLRRNVNVRHFVYALWLAGILPFSVYLRSELTSLVTVLRPADHMDTLSELEKALDDHKVLVCVTNHSSEIKYLQEFPSGSEVLVDKLRANFLYNINRGIVRNSLRDCLRCALTKNHVCLTWSIPICQVKKAFPDLGKFKQPLTGVVAPVPVQKEFRLIRPFRRFMRSISEGHLFLQQSENCEAHPEASQSTLELWSFFRQFLVLHSFSCLIFVAEILFGKFFVTANSLFRDQPLALPRVANQ